LEIIVREIKGSCLVYKVGDRITIDDPKILLEKTDALCTHAFSTLLHYTPILEHDCCPVKLGLTRPDTRGMLICNVDPGEPYTKGGTVIFECREINENNEDC
jgi:uncharacterized repeat protein (TIGR04076 family)